MSENPPIETLYVGNIEVSIWENRNEERRVYHSVTAKRTYMDDNGNWRDTGMVHLLPQHVTDMILVLVERK
jgi:hypothetical protein